MSKKSKHAADNHDARHRLVIAALRLFADKGFEGATTREIAESAGANISAIRYYFGDKAGLYWAAFTEPLGELPGRANYEAYLALPLAEALALFFKDFLEPLKMGPDINLVMKLRFREMIEPTGALRQEIDTEIKPRHEALITVLKQHFRLQTEDEELHRLTFAIIGMAVHFYVGQDIVTAISPKMLNTTQSIDTLAQSLAVYAAAMIEAESRRRATNLGGFRGEAP